MILYNNTLEPRIIEPIIGTIPDCNISTTGAVINRKILRHIAPLVLKTHIYKYKESIKKEIEEAGGNGLINLKVQVTTEDDIIICSGDIIHLN